MDEKYDPLNSLKARLGEAPGRIAEAKSQGKKVVGYFGPYVPEELILAAGMQPLHLSFGGDAEAAAAGDEFLTSENCAFSRSCLGYRKLAKNSYFTAVDAVCVPYSCESMKKVQEYWEKYFGVPSIPLGVPQTHNRLRTKPQAEEYFKEELKLLQKRLEAVSGQLVKERDLHQSIALCNSIREKLWILFEYPIDGRSPIEWRQVFQILNAGYLLDRNIFNHELETIINELENQGWEQNPHDERARLMIFGSTIGAGDNKVLDIVRDAGGNIVADGTCTGSMFARKKVRMPGVLGDPIDLLTERYLYNFTCSFMTDLQIRVNNALKVARDYQVHGMIYYALRHCDTSRADYKYVQDALYNELSVPTLLIETDYASDDTGIIKEQVENFIKRIEGQV